MGVQRVHKFSAAELEIIRNQMAHMYCSQSALAASIDLHVTTLSKILSEKPVLGASERIRLAIETQLRLDPGVLTRSPVRSREAGLVTDTKIEIRNQRVSQALRELRAGKIPSLRRTFKASCPLQFIDVAEKFEKSRHFFQVSTIVLLGWKDQMPDDVAFLTRRREPWSKGLKDSITRGQSILLAASPNYRQNKPTGLDVWLKQSWKTPEQAAEAFCAGDGAILASILSYKMAFPPCSIGRGAFKPFGIVTNSRKGNFYTQYVFAVELRFGSKPSRGKLSGYSIDQAHFGLTAVRENPNTICTDDNDNPLNMDIAIWKAWRNPNLLTIEEETAHFCRGFAIL